MLARGGILRDILISLVVALLAMPVYFLYRGEIDRTDLVVIAIIVPVFTLAFNVLSRAVSPFQQRTSFLFNFLITLGVALTTIAISFTAGIGGASWLDSLTTGKSFQSYFIGRMSLNDDHLVLGFKVTAITTVLASMFFAVANRIGLPVLRDWLTGRYYRPRAESRAFMLIDLRGSTSLAESPGDLKFSALLHDLFADIGAAVNQSEGEVSSYIGDGVLVSWREKKVGNCLGCYFRAVENIRLRADYYRIQYGSVPAVKAGAHYGPVVVTEVGTVKKEFVFHGDVLNTTARIESLCNEVRAGLLVSRALLEKSSLNGLHSDNLGLKQLKGREQEVEVFSIT